MKLKIVSIFEEIGKRRAGNSVLKFMTKDKNGDIDWFSFENLNFIRNEIQIMEKEKEHLTEMITSGKISLENVDRYQLYK